VKMLFLLLVLLAPSLAYAGNPSADLSVQIVPPPPPSGPTPPPQAVAAGYTTLYANLDWQNGQVCVYDGRSPACVSATPVSNWFDCGGSTALFHQSNGINDPNLYPCNASVVTDPGTNTQAMDIYYDPSYPTLYGSSSQWGTQYADAISSATYNNTISFTYPGVSYYFEADYRIDVNSDPNYNGPNGPFQGSYPGNGAPVPCSLDLQPAELYGNSPGGSDGSITPCNGFGAGAGWTSSTTPSTLPAGYATTNYHKYGALVTNNGTNSIFGCMFVDDILQTAPPGLGMAPSCQDVYRSTANPTQFSQSPYIVFLAGAQAQPPVSPPTLRTNVYTRHLRIWTCAVRTNGQCPGSTLSGSAGSLAYWHN
jgi:hypothetical protein